MPPILSQGSMLWETLPWESVLRASCPRQRLQHVVTQKVQRAFRSAYRKKGPDGKILPELTWKRRAMNAWLKGPGKVFETPADDSTNYLTAYDKYGNLIRAGRGHQAKLLEWEEEAGIDEEERTKRLETRMKNISHKTNLPKERRNDLRPFPNNREFFSERVLSEELRNLICDRVLQLEGDVSAVSAAYGIDMRRVAAVVRLKTIEKRWESEGKKLAKAYNDAVLAMLPQTEAPRNGVPQLHESINDLPVHPATRNQLFYPTSESRHFTRTDAAQAFSQTLLPADDRINHPKLIKIEKWALQGLGVEERKVKVREIQREEQAKNEAAEEQRRAEEQRNTRTVPSKRWHFKFQNISVNSAGPDGRSPQGVGIRYGMPHDDRKKGKYKLPTSVE